MLSSFLGAINSFSCYFSVLYNYSGDYFMNNDNIILTFVPDSSGNTPIYVQLSNFLQLQISSGRLKEKDRILPEEEISKKLGISRTTVRQAMDRLVKQGYLSRYRGKGTFVSARKYSRPINHLYNFTADMLAAGIKPSSQTVSKEVIDASDDLIREKLELSNSNTKVFQLSRIRIADGNPVLFENTYIPYYLCPGIEKFDFENSSLYETLKTTYRIIPYTAVETLQGILVPDKIRSYLKCRKNTVGYEISRIARLDSGIVYEYTHSVTRADLCSYQFHLNGSNASGSSSMKLLT